MDKLVKEFYISDEKRRSEIVNLLLDNYKESIDYIINNINLGVELRNNAYLLNVMSKKKRVCEYLDKVFNKNIFDKLISDSDPKTRKNTYILFSNYINKDYIVSLVNCLNNEQINYCISSLILTLGNYKIKNINDLLDKYENYISKKYHQGLIMEVHFKEIIESINKVRYKNITSSMHNFIGFDKEYNVYLTVMPSLINASFNDIFSKYSSASKYKDFVIIKTSDYKDIYKLRSFYEALIGYENNINLTINQVIENINSFLDSNSLSKWHEGEEKFFYRIEYVTSKNKQEKIDLYKNVNENIMNRYKGKYINSPSFYEFEIRIIDNEDKYDIFYKLYTYKDVRYSYRIKDLPASINPTSAYIMLLETKKYFKDNHKVLDPFCGTSTMLIERSKISNAILYGLDIDARAIEYSRINSKSANLNINFCVGDACFVKGKYDEIISNMPYGNRVGNHKSNEILYSKFISLLPNLLNDDGVAILLTSEISLMKNCIKKNNRLKLVNDIYTQTSGLTPHLFVIKKV